MKQGSHEWLKLRAGKITGSRFSKAMARKGSKAYTDFIDQLVQERRLNASLDGDYINEAMQWGMDHEPAARKWYAGRKRCKVHEVAFVPHPLMEHVGVSPDGLVGNDGLIEIKCPQRNGFEQVVHTGKMPARYRWQVQGGLWVCERRWADFVCFYPPSEGVVLRIAADENDFDNLEVRCKEILRTVECRLSVGSGGESVKEPRRQQTKKTQVPAVRQRKSSPPETASQPSRLVGNEADRSSLLREAWGQPHAIKRQEKNPQIPIWVWVLLVAVIIKIFVAIFR
jgi:putative phage-type endonuclease